VEDVFIRGNYAYVSESDCVGLQIIDISDPSLPLFKGYYRTPGWSYGLYVSGDYAFMADGHNGLHIIDISDPELPSFRGNLDIPGIAFGIDVVGNFAYLSGDFAGLHVINVENPEAPHLKAIYDTPGNAKKVKVLGEHAFVADESSMLILGNLPTGIIHEEKLSTSPSSITLYQNYPNPFNSATTIKYSLPETADVKIALYNVYGQKISTLVDGKKERGTFSIIWNGTDDDNLNVSSGLYICRITAGKSEKCIKIIYMR